MWDFVEIWGCVEDGHFRYGGGDRCLGGRRRGEGEGREVNCGVGVKPGELEEGHENQESDYVYKSNGNPDAQVHENGDGDLPSFSIKRLRRLPLRVACEQQPPSGPDGGIVVETVEQRKALSAGPGGADAAHSSGGFSDLSRREDDVVVSREEGSDAILEAEPESENGKHAIEEAELRNPGGGAEAGAADGPDLSLGRVRETGSPEEEKQTGNVLDQEKQAGNDLGQEVSEENKGPVAAPEHALDSSNTLIGESGNTLTQPHKASANPEAEHSSALEALVNNQRRENASPETSDPPSPSAGLESVSENTKDASPAEDPNREDKGKVAEDTNVVASIEPALEMPPLGLYRYSPVMGSRFESPGETTDEETDSPRSSEGFAYPDPDAMALPYSGQIMYPSRFSSAQTSNGPSLLQYSGSMSLRSDSSTTSNRSFAFPILAPPEWNSSPVRMAKAHPRRKNRFEGCCFFRLSRIRNKY